MRIIDEVQLDFSDVLIQPKRSTLSSRKEVNIFRTFKWKDANGEQHQFKAIPCCAANMGTTGTLKMAEVLAKHGYMCALEKHFLPSDLVEFYERMVADAAVDGYTSHEYTQRIFPTIGVNDHLGNFLALYEKDLLTGVVIDIANGYITKLVDKVKEVRKHFPDIFIVVGNVVTADITTDLILAGANCVKVGIGGGCFQGNMKVMTLTGLKAIKDISVGEKVLTHTGKYEDVVNKFTFNSHKKIIDINGIKCTPNHKFYVAKNEDLNKITEENYKDYCIWIEAQNLDTTKYKLVKITQNQD